MHLHAAQPQIFQFTRACIHALDVFKGDAEFIFVSAGGDLGMRVRLDVRIHAHGDGRDFFQAHGDFVDALQFRFTFGIEASNIFNHRNYEPPNMEVDASGFGSITALQTAEGAGPRSLELVGRITF